MARPPTSDQQRDRARALQDRIWARREELGMDIEALARAADVNRRSLDRYFSGDSPSPSFFLVAALARALQLDLNDLA